MAGKNNQFEQYEYHVKPEERRYSPDSDEHKNKKQKSSLFKSNRTLIIILLDVMLLMLIWALVNGFILNTTTATSWEGFTFSAEAYDTADGTAVALEVINGEGKNIEESLSVNLTINKTAVFDFIELPSPREKKLLYNFFIEERGSVVIIEINEGQVSALEIPVQK